MTKITVSGLLVLVVGVSTTLGAYPDTYTAGYGFVSHGGIGPHGHYLPAVARVKVHKDPFQSHYSLDEEGPTHYKYIRHSSSPVIHHPPPLLHQHHHHGHIAPAVAPVVSHAPPPIHIHGGVVPVAHPAVPLAAAVPVQAATVGLGYESGPYFGDYGALYPHAHGGFY